MPHEENASIVLDSSPTRANVAKITFREHGRQGDDDFDNATADTMMSWSAAYTSYASGSCDLSVDDESSISSYQGEQRSKSSSRQNDCESPGRSAISRMISSKDCTKDHWERDLEGGSHQSPATSHVPVGAGDNQEITQVRVHEKAGHEKGELQWISDEMNVTASTCKKMTEFIAPTREDSCSQSDRPPVWNDRHQKTEIDTSADLPTSGKLAYIEDCVRSKRSDAGRNGSPVDSNSDTPAALMDFESMVVSDTTNMHRPGAYIVRTALAPSRGPPLRSSAARADCEPSSAFLVEASLVVDEPASQNEHGAGDALDAVFEAKPLKETSLWKSRRIQCAVFWIVMLTSGAAVGITIGLMMKNEQSTQSIVENQDSNANQSHWEPTPSPTRSPRSTDFIKELQSELPLYTAIALRNEESPQSKAFQWIRQNPPATNNSLTRTTQRFALATLFFATDGMNWDNNKGWLNETSHECDWFMSSSTETGPSCDPAGEAIVSLRLVQNSLSGTIPSEIALLESLRTLQLELSPELHGSIPDDFKSSSVTDIQLNENGLTGFLPDLNPNVTIFLASENNLEGQLPDSYANLTRIDRFDVRSNKIAGMFAEDIYNNWLIVTSIDLSDNQFTGSITEKIGVLSSLTSLRLKTNNFTGPVPSDVGRLTGLHELQLGENSFTGPIPSEIGLARRLQVLDLETNQHTGTIPSELQLLTDLQELKLGGNSLVGTLPKGFMSLEHVQVLSFGQNRLNGTIPTDALTHSPIQILSLHHNQFTGMIPSFSNFSSLIELRLNSNNLTGTIPDDLGLLRSLEVLNLEDNLLSGTVPSALGSLDSITEIILSGNRLNGTVPVEVCALIQATNAKVEIDCDRVACDCGCTCCGTSHSNST